MCKVPCPHVSAQGIGGVRSSHGEAGAEAKAEPRIARWGASPMRPKNYSHNTYEDQHKKF
jgi:hypothetical protein